MNEYTANDFVRAKFATHPDGKVAARTSPGASCPWVRQHDSLALSVLTDSDMARGGWVPVKECPDPDEHDSLTRWRGMYQAANRRAAKAELQRDEARADRDSAERERDDALARAGEAEQERDTIRLERDSWWARANRLAAQPRALTPDAIPVREFEAMADRALARWEKAKAVWAPRDAMREAMRAALTEPPSRPEGAEEIECELTGVGPLELDNPLSAREQSALADFLAERGVRVVTEEER